MTELAGIQVDGRGYLLRKGGGWLHGVDVSHHQVPGSVDLAGQDFLCARGSYGTNPDATFAAHAQAARDAGLLVGAYLFYRQTQDKQEQLDAFLGAISGTALDIVPALDLEWNTKYDGTVHREAHNTDGRWIAEQLASRFGGCLIYTAPFFWCDSLGSPEWCKEHHFWLAHYGVGQGNPRLPANAPPNMTQWAIHQWQGAPLDRNVANYLPAVRDFVGADTEPSPPPEAE